ncbi:MAG: MOSC domain-containing protein [Parvularculaceae bacterium]
MTQRSHPVLATIDASPGADSLTLRANGEAQQVKTPARSPRAQVSVWGSQVDAAIADAATNQWLSAILGEPVRLAFMDHDAARETPREWTPSPSPLGFADALPFLIATTASLKALNDEIEAGGGAPVVMARFRPNIVIDHDAPWAEDHWRQLRIGDAIFDCVKPCARCVITTIDQQTGEATGKEPLKSLAKLRRSTDRRINGVLFGVNAIATRTGQCKVGDAVEVLA